MSAPRIAETIRGTRGAGDALLGLVLDDEMHEEERCDDDDHDRRNLDPSALTHRSTSFQKKDSGKAT